MTPEAQLWTALRAQSGDIARHPAWLDLFLSLTQPRIESLSQILKQWANQANQSDLPLPFAALSIADELAGLCAEQSSPSLAELSESLNQALQRVSRQPTEPHLRQDLTVAVEELLRQLHQYAAGVNVVTPPHILQKLGPH
jgi:hypothetical protein